MSQLQTYPNKKEPPSQEVLQKRKEPKIVESRRASPELAHGQAVIVFARWILVVAGLFLIVWNPDPLNNLRIQVMTIMVLALMNFFLQAHILMGRQTITLAVYFASVVDFVVITVLIALNGGFTSNSYVFYFPAILAISVAFDTPIIVGYVGSVSFIYFFISLVGGPFNSDDLPVLIARILMMIAVAFCGNLYWHIEQRRREATRQAHEQLVAEVRRGPARQTRREAVTK